MTKQNYRIAVVGAASLLGREIAQELANGPLAASSVTLMDSEQDASSTETLNGAHIGATLDQVGDEAALILAVEPASFDGMDVAVFATRGDAEKYLGTARTLGAAIVDASGAPGSTGPCSLPLRCRGST